MPFEAWDELTARVSERAGIMPIATLVGDCNPNVPNHWIRQQTKDKKLEYYRMSFLDNPEIIDQGSERLKAFRIEFENNPDPKLLDKVMDLFSESGLRRVEKLKNLEGLRFKRGFLGLWASGEGLVFEDFEPETHIVDVSIMPNWKRYLSVDWGFRNPASVIWWAYTSDDRLYAYKEIYQTGLTKPDLIRLIQENCDSYDRIQYAAVDSADQDGVEQLTTCGFPSQRTEKRQSRADRRCQGAAQERRKRVNRQSSSYGIGWYIRLMKTSKTTTVQLEVTDEFLSLSYVEKRKGTNKDDEAVVGDNHGVDGTSYLVQSLKGSLAWYRKRAGHSWQREDAVTIKFE